MEDTGSDSVARSRLTQLFRFLQALDQLRNPVVRDISEQPWHLALRDLPDHECVTLRPIDFARVDPEEEDATGPGSSPPPRGQILNVKRPTPTDCPQPPDIIKASLAPGWDDPTRDLKLSDFDPALSADDRLQRETAFAIFAGTRNAWAAAELPTWRAMDLFERLYALQSSIARESERVELVLGDGLLRWRKRDGESINHPILLQRVQLLFDPEVPEFSLVEADTPPDLYTAVFRSFSEVSASALANCRIDLDTGLYHPLGGIQTTSFFRRLIVQLSPHGKFADNRDEVVEVDEPLITRDPIIVLRKRTLGFGRAIESILEDIKEREDVPRSLTTVLGIEQPKSDLSSEITSPSDFGNSDDDTILLTKPANAEQIDVALRLKRHGLVLVQGPPGTGKTHTIGNLIGHLLAQGKSILVTSHTAKALRVLRDKIVETLQPLCVSVLDDSRSQMADAIDGITDRLSLSDADGLAREAKGLDNQRGALIVTLRQTRRALLDALQDEYRPIVIDGKEYAPSEAARFIQVNEKDSAWIPGPLPVGAPVPLSTNELLELYSTNKSTTQEDENELGPALPDPGELISAAEFSELVRERRDLAKKDQTYGATFWAIRPRTTSELDALLEQAKTAASQISSSPAWQLAAIDAGRQPGPRREAWDELLTLIDEVSRESDLAHKYLMGAVLTLPKDRPLSDSIKVYDEICLYLAKAKKVSVLDLLFRTTWRSVIARSSVDGVEPVELSHFRALKTYAILLTSRTKLLNRWRRQVTQLGGPSVADLGDECERSCQQLATVVKKRLNWFADSWAAVCNGFESVGFDFQSLLESIPGNLSEFGDLKRLNTCVVNNLPAAFAAECAALRTRAIDNLFFEQEKYLHAKVIGEGNKTIATAALSATRNRDPAGYESAFVRIADLSNRSAIVLRRTELLRKLDAVAPGWSAAILLRDGVHGSADLPGDVAKAWLWRQFSEELNRRAQTDIAELQDRVTVLSSNLQVLTADLVDKKAWAAQIERTSLPQRLAIQGWKTFMQKLPKGLGIKRQRLLAEARKLMPQCQSAIPVWIMPLSRVVENFDPKHNRFDVVIVDEASQADVMALTALYLGHDIIVVGDHEQVTPSAVGQRQEEVVKLIDEHLTSIPNAGLYDGQTSIYDLAKTAYPGMVCLREHFRCVEPIIQFSNHLSYNGKIIPLRDSSDVRIQPPCILHRVDSASTDGKINEEEAQAVASLVVASTEQPEYAASTFGVISMVGDEQALRIDQLLQRHLSPMEYKRRSMQCGNSAQFQGDERDVMFLSMVDSSPTDPPLTLRSDGYQGMFKKRFNVAASRARDQMWVVHSLNPSRDLKPDDLRYRLIKHAEDPNSLVEEIERKTSRTESEFERQVVSRLVEAGFTVEPQWKVGAYRIDMVVGSKENRVAVECDGDRWHPLEKSAEDMARQALLERLGWRRFIRLRGSEYFRNPDEAIRRLIERLRALGVQPDRRPEDPPPNQPGDELRERVIRRAAELLRDWRESGIDQGQSRPKQQWGRKSGGQTVPESADHDERGPSASDHTSTVEPTNPADLSPTKLPGFGGDEMLPASNGQPIDPVLFFKKMGCEVNDKRPLGGNLWIIGGQELASMMSEFAARGVTFSFKPEGGKATGHRPAWFTTSSTN